MHQLHVLAIFLLVVLFSVPSVRTWDRHCRCYDEYLYDYYCSVLGNKSDPNCTFLMSSYPYHLRYGQLSSWGTWERCSVTCGGGSQTRWRSCVGKLSTIECRANFSQSQSCNRNSCPIDGGWSKWSQWSICTRTVSGIQTRIRECTNPEPASGGKDCNGTRAVVRECGNMSSCHEAFPLRFWQSGENPSSGIMEIYRKGSWQKLCTRSWDTDEENLTCKVVGYSNSVGYDNGTWYTDNINASNAIHYNCTTLTECGGDIDSKAQICKVPVRLSGAKIEYGGRVEVFYQGKWGKICSSQWNFEDVEVICRQLGFKRAVAKFVAADVKEEQIPFVMSDVACNGDEPELASCPRTDGKLNVDCQNSDTGAQALCEPKKKPTAEVSPRPYPKPSVGASIARLALEWYYIVGPVLGCIAIFAVGWYIYKRRRAAVATFPDQEQAVEMQLLNVEVDEWEIAVDRLQLQEVIGRGAFGAVWRALLSEPDGKPGNRTVAAKCFTSTSGEEGRKSLMREIELGKLLGGKRQANIVAFIGCVTTQVHPIMVMEYLACGDLLGYLRKSRGIHDKYHFGQGNVAELEIYDLVLFAKQIAAGMVFLGSRGIIHRDLAARNVLLDDNYVCKVTDFGLAYQNFKYGHGNAKKGCMPVKWTAPEILSGKVAELSPLSDVWSYGIVLYEIFTIGGIPYPGWSEGRVVQAVLDGYQMPKPDHIDDQLYDVMTRCWNVSPAFRPPFENLRKRMDTYLREETYTELLNMGKYDSVKYSKVEDLGAEDEPPNEPQVKTSTTGKKLGKWSSVR